MEPILYNPQDPYFVGEVDEVLLDPRATFYRQPPVGHVFNPAWPVQKFTFPAGPEVIHTHQFVVDENEDPQIAPLIITPLQKTRLNMIGNPNLEHADMTMPKPIVPLGPNQKIVRTVDGASSGILMGSKRWMVVDTTKTPQVPPTSPAGGSYTDADRARDNATAGAVRDIKKALGI